MKTFLDHDCDICGRPAVTYEHGVNSYTGNEEWTTFCYNANCPSNVDRRAGYAAQMGDLEGGAA
jgi:hypothetical protein